MMNENHHLVLLRVATEAIFSLEATTFHNIFLLEKELVNAINPYLRCTNSAEVRLYVVEMVKTIGFRAPRWIHNLVSYYLSMASIQNADN